MTYKETILRSESMADLIKRFIILCVKNYKIKFIDKQCDKYFKIKTKLDVQQYFVNELIDRFEKEYGENLRTSKSQ